MKIQKKKPYRFSFFFAVNLFIEFKTFCKFPGPGVNFGERYCNDKDSSASSCGGAIRNPSCVLGELNFCSKELAPGAVVLKIFPAVFNTEGASA